MKTLRSVLAGTAIVVLLAGVSSVAMAQTPVGAASFSSVSGSMPTGLHVPGTGHVNVAHGIGHYRGYEFVIPDLALDDPHCLGEVRVTWNYDWTAGSDATVPYWGTISIESPSSILIHGLQAQGMLERVAGQFGLGGAREGGWVGPFTGIQLGEGNVVAGAALISDLRSTGMLERVAGQFGLGAASELALGGSPVTHGAAMDIQGLLDGRGAYDGLGSVFSAVLPAAGATWDVAAVEWLDHPALVAPASGPNPFPWLEPQNR